jgi:transcriptional regulator with XRE-family HTH domain
MSLPQSHDPLAVYSIGLKLRTLRTAKGLTLTRLGDQTGFSTALLSKLETDRMVPTLQTLEKICRVYGIGLGHFFCEPEQHALAITRKAHAPGRGQDNPRTTPLHAPSTDDKLLSRILDLPPGAASTVGECGTLIELTAHVLEGTLHVNTVGSAETVHEGDSLYVRTRPPLIWSAADNSRCRVLVVSAK